MPELWDDGGGKFMTFSGRALTNGPDTFVYLFPQTWGRGPSFKVDSQIYASSTKLVELARLHMERSRRPVQDVRRRPLDAGIRDMRLDASSNPGPTPQRHIQPDYSSLDNSRHTGLSDELNGSPQPINLHLPLSLSEEAATGGSQTLADTDIETLIDIRNMFAFLVGQAIVATERRNSVFALFLNISKVLQAYTFTNIDGSTFGETATNSFDSYVDELGLGDVRSSREKTIEGLVLGERMRSVSLFNEAFVHAVGKYDEIQHVSKFAGVDVKFGLISSVTRNRLERASIDLAAREKAVNSRLLDFDFPSIFAGVMNSKTVDERRAINFDAWKSVFNTTRRYVMSYLKAKYGSWPPKASSKKNDLETSGLNRIVLKALYYDFADLYDLYVDRSNLTTRTMGVYHAGTEDDPDPSQPEARVLRRVCDEYDRSSPPVQPPVPFDVPLFPDIRNLPKGSKLSATDRFEARKMRMKKIPAGELPAVLDDSTNQDTLAHADPSRSHFLVAMRTFEARQARGCSLAELTELRAGMWIFIYAVLQALPMLVVDAPGIKWHQGVEYFLCEPPRSGVSWARPSSGSGASNGWYSVSSGGGMVSLPSDLVEHGVEGVYRRSHCWLAAGKWSTERHRQTAAGANMTPLIGTHAPLAGQNSIESEHKEQADVQRHETKRLAPSRMHTSDEETRPLSPDSRPTSRDQRNRETVIGSGLEALPLPPEVVPSNNGPGRRAASAHGYVRMPIPDGTSSGAQAPELRGELAKTGGMTFDDILGGMEKDKKKSKR